MATESVLLVCTTCRLAASDRKGPSDGMQLSEALTKRGVSHEKQECFSACTRSCVIALRGRGRWTYVQGNLDPAQHLDDVIQMARAYAETTDGVVPWRQRPEVIRKNTVARIPPMEV